MRRYELSRFNGEQVPFKYIKERRALIGKRIGYDLYSSCFSQFGYVQNATVEGFEMRDGSTIRRTDIQQVVVLVNQGETKEPLLIK